MTVNEFVTSNDITNTEILRFILLICIKLDKQGNLTNPKYVFLSDFHQEY